MACDTSYNIAEFISHKMRSAHNDDTITVRWQGYPMEIDFTDEPMRHLLSEIGYATTTWFIERMNVPAEVKKTITERLRLVAMVSLV